LKAFLLHHQNDLDWVRRSYGPDVQIIAHENYLPALLGETLPCFFNHGNYATNADEAINFISHNWHRDEIGRDLCVDDGLSIAEVFSTGLWTSVAYICREYFALKYWCDHYDCVYVSCNEHPGFLNVTKKFGSRVQIYDPGHRQPSLLSSYNERVLGPIPKVSWLRSLLRILQTPFLGLLRNRTLALGNSTLHHITALNKKWISENSRYPWKGAYSRKPLRKYLAEAECRVPRDFPTEFTPTWLTEVLQRINIHWDGALIGLLSETMTDRYHLYRDYFVTALALYKDMLNSYSPTELVVYAEFYEPCLLAAQLAKARGIKVSWLVDGYPTVDSHRCIGNLRVGPVMFDRIYAVANQHRLRLLKNKLDAQEIITIFPPILNSHDLLRKVEKRFDAIIMTWIPNDLGISGFQGSRPITLLDALRVATESGLEKLAIKIKHPSEKQWLLPVLEKTGYLSRVTILEGALSDHVTRASRIIGGISSAVGETAYHDIPYYIYEPVANGYSSEQIASAVVIAEGGVARTPAELRELLKCSEGSVIADRALLFGTECRYPDWSWDQTRELYTDWVAVWADHSGIKDVLQWRGFPLWWASNPVHKDTSIHYAWYQELHNRLHGLPAEYFQPRTDTTVYFGIFKSLTVDMVKWLLLRLLPTLVRPDGERIWFHSLEYNLLNTQDGFYDRMYEQTFIDDKKYGFVSAFIIRLTFKRADFFHPWLWRRRIANLENNLQRDVEILDRHFHLSDIFEIHFSLFKNYFKFRKFIKPLCRQGIRIGHAEFADILLLEIQKSFVSIIPWSLSYAAMFERWLQKNKGDKTLVTYGETLAPMRAVYFVTRRHAAGHRWISIQHATVYKNKMGFYHRFSEFNQLGPDDRHLISPQPDYYFVHGPQFSNILAEFYSPDRIRMIGCLKYDRLNRLYGQNRPDIRQSGEDRVMLLAPSVGDEEIILRMFVGLRELPGWRIMLSRHPTVSQDKIVGIIQRNKITLPIKFDLSKSTIQVIENCSLVVCSYSSIALESYFLGVPSVRVLNPEQPPIVEDESGLTYITSQEEFLRVLRNFAADPSRGHGNSRVKQTLDYYFLHFDGMASARFWENLRTIRYSMQTDLCKS
jgi:hypothetical protein